jgi:hypothetical protein
MRHAPLIRPMTSEIVTEIGVTTAIKNEAPWMSHVHHQ